jgi:hypothetical protein
MNSKWMAKFIFCRGIKMGVKDYELEEIESASGKNLDTIDPDTSFLVGPTSESELVYAFANKLNALYFLLFYFEDHLSEAEKEEIDAQIKTIGKTRSDAGTKPLSELVIHNDSIEIHAEGYWDDFLFASQPFWEGWVERSGEFFPDKRIWEDDEVLEALDDRIEDDGDGRIEAFLYSDPPRDVYDSQFVAAMLSIIPLA